MGRTASVTSHVYLTNYGVPRGGPALYVTDHRISGDGVVYFRKDSGEQEPLPLTGRFIGADIAEVSLEPESKLVQVSAEAGRIIVRPVAFGVSGPHRIVVKSTLGHLYTSDQFTFNNDNVGPRIEVGQPGTPFISGTTYTISATLRYPSGLHWHVTGF